MTPRRVLIALTACALAAGVLAASCSSNDGKSCPQCLPGQICNQATGTCVPVGVGCPATGCGTNALCRADNVCSCNAGFVDCNQDLGQPGSNGCECAGGCSGAACATAGGCVATIANACGGSTLFCSAGTCAPCPPGQFNCDGINDCESATACGGAGCDRDLQGDCGGSDKFCDANLLCAACPEGQYNCDGIQLCESYVPCVPISGDCDPSCQKDDRRKCAKNPAKNNFCEECLTTEHCQNNPGSMGPFCDTSDLAGTGQNYCICKTESDCATSTQGHRCLVSPSGTSNPAFKQCSCKTGADCPQSYPLCMYGDSKYVLGRCTPRCTKDDDCEGLGLGTAAYCQRDTGQCDVAVGP